MGKEQTMSNEPEERMAILKMIEEDKITAVEGLKLLESLGKEGKPAVKPASPPAPRVGGINSRMFRVVVTNLATGRPKVNVTLPLSLVNWGLRVGGRFSKEVEGIDLEELGDILQSNTEGKIIDVMDEEDGEHVEIYID
jgi:hypothetical protein